MGSLIFFKTNYFYFTFITMVMCLQLYMHFYLSEVVVTTILQRKSFEWNTRRSWGNQGNHESRFSPAVIQSKGIKTLKLHPPKSGLSYQLLGSEKLKKSQRASAQNFVFSGSIKKWKLWERRDKPCTLF